VQSRNGKVAALYQSNTGRYTALALSAEEDVLAALDQGDIHLFDADNLIVGNQRIELSRIVDPNQSISAIAFSPVDNSLLAIAGDKGWLGIWKLGEHSLGSLQMIFDGDHTGIDCVKFTHDGKRLVSISRNYQITIWDVASGDLLQTSSKLGIRIPPEKPWNLEISPDDRFLLVSNPDSDHSESCALYTIPPARTPIPHGPLPQTIEVAGKIRGVELASNERHVVVRTDNAQIPLIVWDTKHNKLVTQLLSQAPIQNLSFSEQGDRLLLEDTDNIWLYAFPPPAEGLWKPHLKIPKPDEDVALKNAILSLDGRKVFVRFPNKIVLFDVQTGQRLAEKHIEIQSYIWRTSDGRSFVVGKDRFDSQTLESLTPKPSEVAMDEIGMSVDFSKEVIEDADHQTSQFGSLQFKIDEWKVNSSTKGQILTITEK
ncbi:MAG: WD40 repeat domain-containing protein, partial [Planctomycetaceae bacterium]|nr:WD40 repeat domain-containing protein [Planctomycetaceae bacterium]